jgi:hypothetical protein
MRSRVLILLVPFLLILLVASVSGTMVQVFDPATPVVVNSTSVITDAQGVPFEMWILSIVASLVIILLSFFSFKHGEEGIISVMAWFTSGFALASAYNVDQITVSNAVALASGTVVVIEKHSLYHFDTIAMYCLAPMLVLALANTARIWINMRSMRQIATVDSEEVGTE